MSKTIAQHSHTHRFLLITIPLCLCTVVSGVFIKAAIAKTQTSTHIKHAIVLTQLPTGTEAQVQGACADGMLRADYGDQGRLILLHADSSTRVLTPGFHGACDPAVSFDGTHLLFSGKKTASDPWHIFEMAVDGSNVRQVTQGTEDHRSRCYEPTI